jgi:prefoldin alpha subunit
MAQQVNLSQLNLQQLEDLNQQLTAEVENFTSNMIALQQTATRFATAGQSVEYLMRQKGGQAVLLPLTDSLYVLGELESVDTVLLDVGTGYYVEVIDGSCRCCAVDDCADW